MWHRNTDQKGKSPFSLQKQKALDLIHVCRSLQQTHSRKSQWPYLQRRPAGTLMKTGNSWLVLNLFHFGSIKIALSHSSLLTVPLLWLCLTTATLMLGFTAGHSAANFTSDCEACAWQGSFSHPSAQALESNLQGQPFQLAVRMGSKSGLRCSPETQSWWSSFYRCPGKWQKKLVYLSISCPW